MSVPLAPTVTIAPGVDMPQLGLGTWPMDDAQAEEAVAGAIGLGYRSIDTAFNYGNETGVGRGLAASGVPRDELFVTTKLNKEDHGVDEVRRAFERSATRLGIDTIDLFLIHWPNPDQDRYVDAFRGLIALRDEGLIRAAGVSNFKQHHLDRLEAEVGERPALDQIQVDPTLPRPGLRSHLEHAGVTVESWSPIGGSGSDLLVHPVIVGIGEELDRTPCQVVLRWHVQKGLITVPKSADPGRQAQNLDVFSFTLDEPQVSRLEALDSGEEPRMDPDSFGH